MKKTLLITAFIILMVSSALTSQAQMTMTTLPKSTVVGKIKIGLYEKASLEYHLSSEKDTVYMLSYRNEEYKTITDYQYLTFVSNDGTVNVLYNTLKSLFTEESKAKTNDENTLNFKLGDSNIIVIPSKILGKRFIYFFADKKYFSLLEKDIDKLFGKEVKS